ncbi:MAG: Smr/MutS family protein [bacterium]
MNYKAIQKLEFHKILERLEGYCGSAWGKESVSDIAPAANAEATREALARTSEARRFYDQKGVLWDFASLPDLQEELDTLESGHVLEPVELDGFRRALNFAASVKGERLPPESFPNIDIFRERLFAGTAIARRIEQTIDEKGQIKDNASPLLARTRKNIREIERDIPDRLKKLINDPGMDDVVQDRIVTVRNGRFVIPVRSDNLSRRQWVLQDRSASGATSFVEPLELVEDNNRLTRERLSEKAETLRILRELTSLLAEHAVEISESLGALGELDCLIARGRFSASMKAIDPEITEGDEIRIIGGRHPLLTGEAIPINVEVGGRVKTLILTGPNAGGKTVTLKMIGLFQLMAQSGLHVPATDANLPICSDIFAIIGDEQSVEDNLSTFSSHLKEVRWAMERARGGSLVLIDEICAGTDPEEGTALACSILKELMAAGAVTLVTSHHSGLKTFASVTAGAENARMVFDERTRAPIFRVETGMPGKSYALEIAERAGFSERTLAGAREYLSSQARMTERLINELESMKSFVKIERDAIENEKKKLRTDQIDQSRKLDELKRQNEEALQAAYTEAEQILEETRRRCDEILRAAKGAATLPAAAAVKGEITQAEKKVAQKKKPPQPRRKGRAIDPSELKPDARYLLRDTAEEVLFVSGPDRKGRVSVLLGDFRVTTDARNLMAPEYDLLPELPKSQDHTRYILNAKAAAKSEIDLRGLRAAEAIETLDKEIGTLVLAGSKEARIIHGIGTGALIKAVHEYLAGNTYILRFESCDLRQGGIGATRIVLSE